MNDAHPIIGFSKTYDDSFNPQSAFAAILTCSQADGACPLLLVLKRIPITFEDPKHLIIHPTRRKNRKKRPNRYGLFYVFSK
jgi:arsenate reductase